MYVCTSCTVVSLSTTSVNLNTPPLTWTAPFDVKLGSQTRNCRSTKTMKARLLTVSCLNNSVHRGVYNHSLVLKASICSLSSCHHGAFKGSESSRQGWRSHSFHKISRCILLLLLLCFSLFSSLDPFIVRSVKLVHRSLVSHSFAHPSRCSRPTLTIVCFCAASPSSCSGVWDPRSLDYQSCRFAVLLQY